MLPAVPIKKLSLAFPKQSCQSTDFLTDYFTLDSVAYLRTKNTKETIK